MNVSTIIVNYNAGETLEHCVQALFESTESTSLTLVDNASTDNSAEKLRNLYKGHDSVKFLANRENIGFAPAVNAAAQSIETDLILVLNPDCILQPETLGRLKQALVADQSAAIAGPAVLDIHGRIQRATLRRFPNPWKSLVAVSGLWRLEKWFPAFQGIEIDLAEFSDGISSCDAVSGACMLIKRSSLETVGYLDEQYAMHCEDLDLMFRLKQLGLHCLYVPQAVCVHQQGISSQSRPSWVHYQKHRGMARFFRKFQAESMSIPLRGLVVTGIWLRFIILWPMILIKR